MELLRVPSLAENVNEVTVGEWLVAVGDAICPGTEIVELITEKAEFTFEAESEGVVSACLAPTKSVLPVGYVLCVLDGTAEAIAQIEAENETRLAQHLAPVVAVAAANHSTARPKTGRVRATPAARRLAKEQGLELTEVASALGVDGVVKEEHIHAFQNKP